MIARPVVLLRSTLLLCRESYRFHPAIYVRLTVRLLLLLALALLPASSRAQNITTSIPVQIEPYSVAVNPVTNQIYVVSAVSGLTVINGATGATTVLSDTNASGLHAVAVNPVTNLVYVANGSGNVSIFYGATAATAASYDTTVTDLNAAGPWALAVDPVSNLVYVANDGSSNVTVISGTSYLATVGAGAHPDSLAVNPLTHVAYVANRNAAGTLTVITPNFANNPITFTSNPIAVGSSPAAVGVMTASNLVFVACTSDSDVWEFNFNGVTPTHQIIQDSQALGPDSIATNPVTNQVYVANLVSANATIINLGSPNVVHDVPLNSGGSAIAVDVVTNIAYSADTTTGTIGVINGNSLTANNLASGGSSPQEVAVNPVTHRAYIANYNNPGSITVVDGATSVTADLPTSVTLSSAIAVDPATNLIFVADNTNNNVEVINAATNAVQTVPVGVKPVAMVVDSARGFVYVALANDPTNVAVMIRESDLSTGGMGDPAAVDPIALDFNSVNNTVFVANQGSDTLSWYHILYQEETTYSYFSTCHQPNSVAVNSVTDVVWITCNDGNITEINFGQSTPNTFALSAVPVAVAVNPVTNQVYAATSTGDIDIVDGATSNITTVHNGNLAATRIAVNTASGKVYVLNSASKSVTVLDPNNNNTLAQVNMGNNPSGLAVNPVTNKIYVANAGDGTMTVIDGPTNSTYLVSTAASAPAPTAVNPMTNTAFVADTFSGDVTAISEFQPQASGLTVAIQPLVGVGTDTLNQDFDFTVTNTGSAPADQVLYQVDTWQGQWQQATLDSSNQFDGMTTLIPGYHILYAYATAGEEATEASGGLQSSPVIGAMTAYGFLVAPALAQFSHEYFNTNFGTQAVNTPSAPQTITLVNDGGAPLNITDISIGGNNASDFIRNVGAASNDCSNLGGVLPGGTQCNMSVYFQPQTTLDESAILTVTDDSSGVPGSQQTQPMTGNGVPQVTITASGAGSGSISDGNVSLYTCYTFPCTASYLGGQQITFTANPSVGSVFNGFTGDCSFSSGPSCTLTMSESHTFNVDFEPAVVTTYTLTVTELGTGTGTIADSLNILSCNASITPVTCTGTYNSGQAPQLTAAGSTVNTLTSTFGGWSPSSNYTACTTAGLTSGCTVTMNSNMTAAVYFVPPPSMVTLTYNPGAPSNTAYFNCGVSNPSPSNPCPNLNAHQITLGVPAVSAQFYLTVVATEVSPLQADGICETGNTVANDFDCRFVSFFAGPTVATGVRTPLCDAYSNGDCIFYSVYNSIAQDGVTRVEPPTTSYTPPVTWTIVFNDDNNIAPTALGYSPNERLYDDPDYEPSPTTPWGTNCGAAMVTGPPPGTPTTSPAIGPCQFEFDITTFFDPNEVVDRGIGGVTQQFNDVVVAFPLASSTANPNLTVTDTPETAAPGGAMGYNILVANSTIPGAATAYAVALTDNLPGTATDGVNWSVGSSNPPSSCSISGALGSQVLNCSFGTIAPVSTAFVNVTSPAVAGAFTDSATVSYNNATASNPVSAPSSATINVSANSTSFTGLTSAPSITYGATSVTLKGTIGSGSLYPPTNQNEVVTVTINSVSQTALIGSSGAFSLNFSTSTIPASLTPYVITYAYLGDANFGGTTNTATSLIVNKATSTFSAVTASQSIPYGSASIALTGTITSGTLHPPTGDTVTVTIDSISQSTTTTAGGAFTISFTTSAIPASATPYTISYSYAGDTNFTTATNTSTALTVNSAGGTTFSAVTASQSIPYGSASIALTGTITSGTLHPPAGDTVTVTIDNISKSTTTVAGGTFAITFTTSAIPASATQYTITYSYAGDPNFSTATNTNTALTVNRATATFSSVTASQSITVGATPITLGGIVSSGSLYPAVGDTVTVTIDSISQSTTTTTGGAFTMSFITSAIPASATPYTISYSYAGDTNFTTATNTSTALTVNSAASTTFSAVTASQSIPYGTASIALGGTLTSGTKHPPTGETVKVTVDGITQGTTTTGTGGTFTMSFTTSAIPASATPYTITYSYGGDTNFGAATNTGTALTVNKATATFSAVTASQSITAGAASIPLGGTVSSGSLHPPTGDTVTVTVDNISQSTTTTTGGAFTMSFTTSAIPASATPYTISYSYAGDTNFTTATNSSTALTVNPSGGTGLTISPTSLAFGNVYRGTIPVKMVTLTNNTASTVTISSVSLTAVAGGDSYDFVGVNLCAKTLAVKKSCQVEMSFVPNTAVNIVQSAILTIVDSASSTPQKVTMTATVIDPEATPSPTSLSFGTVKKGTVSATKTVTVTNTGLTTTTITSVAASANFALTSAGTCKANATLTSGAKCTLVVTFTPSAKGSTSGKITITDNALNSPQTVTLSGTGD